MMSPEFLRPDWHKKAACRGMAADGGPNPFFPVRGESLEPAQKICDKCPVKRQCDLSSVLHDEEFGVWAGNGREGRKKRVKSLIAAGKLDKELVGSKKITRYTHVSGDITEQ